MDLFQKILATAVPAGASDVHLKIGTPVIFRINRQLVAIEAPLPTAEWMDKVVAAIVPKHARVKLDNEHEVDFSYYVPGTGRFRTNVFQQRGQWCLAMRYVKTQVPSFEELGLLPVIKKIAESPRGIVLVSGSRAFVALLAQDRDEVNYPKDMVDCEREWGVKFGMNRPFIDRSRSFPNGYLPNTKPTPQR